MRDAEVKNAATDEVVEDGEGTAGESSAPEQTQEDESVAEEEKTDSETDSSEASEVPEEKTETVEVEALRKERERILNEIRDLRTERRELRSKPVEPLIVDKPKEDELTDVNPADVTLIEKVLRSKGYVHKDELQQHTYKKEADAVKDAWLEKHPEYLPENDPDDANWKALNTAIQSYFKAPANPKDVSRILDMAHAMVSPRNPLPVRTGATTEAAKQKIAVSSKGASGAGSKSTSASPSKDVSKEHLKGFSDEDIKELFS